jgi:predicted RNase H-like HicB family nuclease
MKLEDYKTVLYRQRDGSWVAEVPAIAGCYALMETKEAALTELSNVFALIAKENREKDVILPSDLKDLYLAERALDRIRSNDEPTISLQDVMKRHDVD